MLDADRQRILINRLIWRVMPLLTLCYTAAVIDRSNVGFAKLQMVGDLRMTEVAFGLGSSLYFIGYLVFEIPSVLVMMRTGTRRWLARIMLTWGLATILLGFSVSGLMFFCLRFVLGVAEAGLHPGGYYFLMTWFPPQARARVFALFQMGGSLGNVLAAVMGGVLLDLNGTFGLAGWQWVFIATGLPPILLGLIVLAYLTDRPGEATFLSSEEKDWIEATVARSSPRPPGNILSVLWEGRVLFFGAVETFVLISLYGIIYWLPTVIKGFGVTGTETGLLTALPWALSAVLMATIPPLLKRESMVLGAFCAIALVGVASFAFGTFAPSSTLRYLGLMVGTPCIQLLIPCTWAVAARYMTGPRAAPCIAAVSTISTLGGFFAQNLMPWVGKLLNGPIYAMLVPMVCLLILAIVPLLIHRYGGRPAETQTAGLATLSNAD